MSGNENSVRRIQCNGHRRSPVAVEQLESRELLSTFTVNSIGDTSDVNLADGVCNDQGGACSLRAAIEQSNADGGMDRIEFKIPGLGPHTIEPSTELPMITDPTVIDGTTQPGFAGSPIIELNGASSGNATGLAIAAENCTVRGLVINRFGGYGISLSSSGSGNGNHTIEGNFIGTDLTGAFSLGNADAGVAVYSGNNLIGGMTAMARNVISGNGKGIFINHESANRIAGNFIGTDVNGTQDLGNREAGILFWFSGQGTLIGGTTPGSGNVISGNDGPGVSIYFSGANAGIVLEGNLIGTDASGTQALGNQQAGVLVKNSMGNTIGGTNPLARNVISGNAVGVQLDEIYSPGNTVQGNFIGTDATGEQALGNSGDGIVVNCCESNSIIGGSMPGAGNVVSGNSRGIFINSASGNFVEGNRIGTNAGGTAALGNAREGVYIDRSFNNIIGGTAPGAENIVSSNGRAGIAIVCYDARGCTKGNTIQGNLIGTGPSKNQRLGNGDSGILIDNVPNNTIGGMSRRSRNIIAFNARHGVEAEANGRNLISRNSIFANGGLGIDLRSDGLSSNDLPERDTAGAVNLQGSPELVQLIRVRGTILLRGRIDGPPKSRFTIEVYANTEVDDTGHGEGEMYLRSIGIRTNQKGRAWFTVALPVVLRSDEFISATATDQTKTTSEFSASVKT